MTKAEKSLDSDRELFSEPNLLRPSPRQTVKPRPNIMPPMTLKGIVTKVGAMKKTATVTVSRRVIHKQTGKASTTFNAQLPSYSNRRSLQQMERSKKYLTHDENNRMSRFQ